MNLSQLNGKRIAVEVTCDDRTDVILGTAKYVQQQANGGGAFLRITVDDWTRTGVVAFILHESKWDGDVRPDREHGCDYSVWLDCAEGYMGEEEPTTR